MFHFTGYITNPLINFHNVNAENMLDKIRILSTHVNIQRAIFCLCIFFTVLLAGYGLTFMPDNLPARIIQVCALIPMIGTILVGYKLWRGI